MSDKIHGLDAMLATKSLAELILQVQPAATSLGFGYWLYALDLPVVGGVQQPFVIGNFPRRWLERYLADDVLRVDPVVAHCRSHATPFVWPRTGRDSSLAAHPELHRLYQDAPSCGLHSGISIPLHGLGCNWGLVSFASTQPVAPGKLARQAAELLRLAHFIHESGHRYAIVAEAAPTVPNLTGREIECLHWAAAGKTSWEIGRVLGVSERTVVFHLRNAAQKFGVGGRQPAVALAIALGVIKP